MEKNTEGGGTMLFCDEYGNRKNPTILLLHGAGALDTFCHQYFLSKKYHLLVPHLHGAGKSADMVYQPEILKQELLFWMDSLHKDKIGVIGHSLGAQMAIRLVCDHPERFYFAIFLSAWINPADAGIKMYCSMAKAATDLLHWKWLVRLQGKYWGYTCEQTDNLVNDSRRITPQIYRSFFENTLDLETLPHYPDIPVAMLAICGSREAKSMKTSLARLARNPHCTAMVLPKAGHDFPMRNSAQLNPVVEQFIDQNIK